MARGRNDFTATISSKSTWYVLDVLPQADDLQGESMRASRAVLFARLLLWIAIGAIACTRAHGESARAVVPRGSVAGRAAMAVGDSGIFASPVLPRDAHPVIPHADAESAAVAFGYWNAPSVQDLTVRYYHEIPTERRHFCGRSYYVRPVVEMPDTVVVQTNSGNDWEMWAPTWVMPICDDEGTVRSSVELVDVPTGLHVIQGPAAHDVPELVPDSGTFPHMGQWTSAQIHVWERGIGMTPETAVAVVAASLGRWGARVVEVPEAVMKVRLNPSPPAAFPSPRVVGEIATCPRWRLMLDRPVTLRGAASAQVVRTRTVYVNRNGKSDCGGDPVLEIPTPSQPPMIRFMYFVRPPLAPGTRVVHPAAPEARWTTVRVLEPLWFEEARPLH